MLSRFRKIFSVSTNSNEEFIPESNTVNLSKAFSDVVNEWLEFHHIEIAESTYYRYKMMSPLLMEYFGNHKICEIDTLAVNNFISKMKRNGMTDAAIYNYCVTLRLCFDYACTNKYIVENPARNACVPKLPRHAEIYPYSISEVMKLLKVDYLQWVKDGIVIAFHTGMRLGEVYALKWTDIDLEQKFIMVQRSQSRAGSRIIIKTTKTSCGIRRIDIDRFLVKYLERMKKQRISDSVFAPTENSNYTFRIPWNIASHIKKMCMLAGIPPRDFHTFRHTHATVLLAHGVHPKIVQERLGHSDIVVTMETYSHVLPTIQREAVRVFEEICDKYYRDETEVVEVFDNIIDLSQYGYNYVDDALSTDINVS